MIDNNQRVAKLFIEMADMLSARRANPYRVKAYRRAAEALAGLTEDVAVLNERGELRRIPGIGRDLAAKIDEFLKTGGISGHRDLQTPLPKEVADWVHLPGLSESLVHYLSARLGIHSLEDLEKLVQSHFLRTLPGFNASEQELLTAIEEARATERARSRPTSDESP